MSSYDLKKNVNTYSKIEINDNIELSSDGYNDTVIHKVDKVSKLKSSFFSSDGDRLLLLIAGLYIIGFGIMFATSLVSNIGTIILILLTILLVVSIMYIIITILYSGLYGMIVIKTGNESIVIKDDKEKINNIYEDIVNIY